MATRNKHLIVLGLGTFGEALARRLSKNGCRVTGVDTDHGRVASLQEELYEAVVADVTDRSVLEQLGLPQADGVFISLGERDDMTPSLLATLHAKELGARQIVVKGLSSDHAKILESLGVGRVVFPESEFAVELADRTTWPNVLDYMPIDPDYSFVEIAVPTELAGRTLQEVEMRRRFHVWVVTVKDALTGKLVMLPGPDFRLTDDQVMLVVGRAEDVERLRELS
jgi:trk system potassium uptake protein TrkA